jgi:hypothetical protein
VGFTFTGICCGQNDGFILAGMCSGQNVGFTFAGMCSGLNFVSHCSGQNSVFTFSGTCCGQTFVFRLDGMCRAQKRKFAHGQKVSCTRKNWKKKKICGLYKTRCRLRLSCLFITPRIINRWITNLN